MQTGDGMSVSPNRTVRMGCMRARAETGRGYAAVLKWRPAPDLDEGNAQWPAAAYSEAWGATAQPGAQPW
jgi:hypothetical protein